jgi:centromeric protein E
MCNLQLAYLPYKRQDLILDDENIDLYVSLEGNTESVDETLKEEKKTRKHGLLNWLKLRVCVIQKIYLHVFILVLL